MHYINKWDHKKRHKYLYRKISELIIDWIFNTNSSPSMCTVMDLVKWSYSQKVTLDHEKVKHADEFIIKFNHKKTHSQLHNILSELITDWSMITGADVFNTIVTDLIEWSFIQTLELGHKEIYHAIK